MIKKKVLDPNRIRRIDGGCSFIPHRFLADGFLATLTQKELLLYLFLIIVSETREDPATVKQLVMQSLMEAGSGR